MMKKFFATTLLVTLLIGVTPVYAASTPADLIPRPTKLSDPGERSLNNFNISIHLPAGNLEIYVSDPDFSACSTEFSRTTLYNKAEISEIMSRLCGVTVLPGDTLSSIAEKYGTTVEKLLELNPRISNPNEILVGEKIQISEVVYSVSDSIPAYPIEPMTSEKTAYEPEETLPPIILPTNLDEVEYMKKVEAKQRFTLTQRKTYHHSNPN